jgi:hypothetical protein
MRRDGVKVFLDSGAFSAFTKGVEPDIDLYIQYIKDNADIIEVASVLDGIGDPLKTWQNQSYMEHRGVRPLPCFHYGEDERYLEYYVANYEWITIGGMVPISTPQLIHWLDRIWDNYLTDDAGHPKTKVHGFGLTTQSLMERYPWYSVDSSSWVQTAAMGGLDIPGKGVVSVSNSSPTRKKANAHFDTLASIYQREITRVVEDYGFSMQRMKDEYISRWSFNCFSYQEKRERRNKVSSPTFKAAQPNLF